MLLRNAIIALLIGVIWACNPDLRSKDPLPSWNVGKAKQDILSFVEKVTSPNSSSYIPVERRIATIDQDGTLWLEKPYYAQMEFVLDRARQLAQKNEVLAREQPFKAILENNQEYLQHINEADLIRLLSMTNSDMNEIQFNDLVVNFLNTFEDSRFRRHPTKLIYQPMLELMLYLRSKGFKTYICTGGETDFVRVYSEEVYGIPPEQVIGSAVLCKFEMDGDVPYLKRLSDFVQPLNEKAGKPVNIQRYIGRKPILAIGNSDGDVEMLEYTDDPTAGASLSILVHHDDPKREYAYTDETANALETAKKKGWLVISMKEDFKRIFPFETSEE